MTLVAMTAALPGLQSVRSADAQTTGGIWISKQELASRPMSGAAWSAVLKDADRSFGTANIADQDSKHDTYTLAAAIVYARTGNVKYYNKAKAGILAAMGTEFNSGTRWLAVGRNLGAYVIAADLLNLRADGNSKSDGTRVQNWIKGWQTKYLPSNNSGTPRPMQPFSGGSNADAQEGFAYASVAAYLKDKMALTRAWDAFRTFACDPTAPNLERIDLRTGVQYGWAHNNSRPCAINPKGTTKKIPSGRAGAGGTYRIDGAIINDMRRGGYYQWKPGLTQYVWTGMAGIVPAAVVLQRAGFPAFAVADKAVLRAADYLYFLGTKADRTWFDGSRGSETVQLVNFYYKTRYPARKPVVVGHTVGYTDFTHPTN